MLLLFNNNLARVMEMNFKIRCFLDEGKGRFFITSLISIGFVCVLIWSINPNNLNQEVWADLTYQAFKDKTNFQSGGTVRIEGWIYNRGSKDVNVIIRLRVNYGTGSGYYGFLWMVYDVPIGVIPKGDKRWLSWECHLNPFDPTTATFNYSIIEING
jgi:hypothetical protein